jgi:hypothetical protein
MSCKIISKNKPHAPSSLSRPFVQTPADEQCAASGGSGGSVWVKENVHSWSSDMTKVVADEFPYLPDKTREYLSRFDEARADITGYYRQHACADALNVVVSVLDKINSRRAARDADLMMISPAGLLAMLWFDYVVPNGCFDHFADTMRDMGSTCVQGDTHRLFSTLVAMFRQKNE